MYSYIYTSYIHKYTYIGYERLCVYVYVYIYVYSAREDGVQVPLQSGCSGRSAPTKRPDRVFACVPHVQCCVWRAAFCFFCRLDQGVCVLASCLPALCPAFSAPGVHLLAFGPAPGPCGLHLHVYRSDECTAFADKPRVGALSERVFPSPSVPLGPRSVLFHERAPRGDGHSVWSPIAGRQATRYRRVLNYIIF